MRIQFYNTNSILLSEKQCKAKTLLGKAVWKHSISMFKPNWGSWETHTNFVLT